MIQSDCRGDVLEIDTWVDAAGKNAMRRDWIIRDYNTQEIITGATRCNISISFPLPTNYHWSYN
ncbi:hypothetical protein CRYUN_Cryun19dG0013100 [Craigia yunnanensis]